MGSKSILNHRALRRTLVALGLALGMVSTVQAATSVKGQVLDIDGRPVGQAQVTLDWGLGAFGASAVTVFTDEQGRFAFSQAFDIASVEELPITARALGFEHISAVSSVKRDGEDETQDLTIVVKQKANQADVAPSSAWLAAIEDPEQKAEFVQQCVSCHQFPSPEVRDYAGAIVDAHGDSELARKQSWEMIVKYMNYLFVEDFARANPARKFTHEFAYNGPNLFVADQIATHFPGRMDYIEGYEYGAPLIVTPNTVIKEYEVAEPNAIREAVLWNDDLWVADVGSDDMIEIDPETGKQRVFTGPYEVSMGPHTLNKDPDGSLWIISLFNAIAAKLSFDDTGKEQWEIWAVKDDEAPRGVGIHDITFDPKHEALADKKGRIWYSNISSNAVGYFDPKTGEADNYLAPEIPGRTSRRAQLYGALMESNQKIVWYSQLGIGAFGSFNTETLEYEVLEVMPSINAGPRRLTITEDDILYVPMFGGGQLVEYDTRAKERIGTYDLPDRGAAPYAVTWDPIRKVVWVATSNADVIYRFDPSTKEFGVLPLPRQRGYLRMLQVDPDTGVLVSSYGNVPFMAEGPRMAFILDPGDGAYSKELEPTGAEG